ncbi:MAG: hypothetical protein ABL890_03325 [Candidatus Peribacteraceae bacterium]
MASKNENRFTEIADGLDFLKSQGATIQDLGLEDKALEHDLIAAMDRDALDFFLTSTNSKSHHALAPILTSVRALRDLYRGQAGGTETTETGAREMATQFSS